MGCLGGKGFKAAFGVKGQGARLRQGPDHTQHGERQNGNPDGLVGGLQQLKEPDGVT